MFVKSKFTDDDSVTVFEPSLTVLDKWQLRMRRLWETRGHGYFVSTESEHIGFATPWTPSGLAPLSQIPEADIINLHWVAAFLDFRLISSLPTKCTSLVWRLSDLNPLSGGCLYDAECGRFRMECGECPCLGSDKINDLSRRSLLAKRKVIRSLPSDFLTIVAQSRWSQRCIEESSIFEDVETVHIPNGIDSERFRPMNKLAARSEFDLPADTVIVMFAAQSLRNPLKGATYFIEATRQSAARIKGRLMVLALGEDEFPDIEGVDIKRLSLNDDRLINAAFSASDIFVITSLQETFPNTVLEAMASGTASIGFDVGGVPDMIDDGKTGYLVPKRDVAALAGRICELASNDSKRIAFAAAGRERIEREFTVETQLERYTELYQSLLERKRR